LPQLDFPLPNLDSMEPMVSIELVFQAASQLLVVQTV